MLRKVFRGWPLPRSDFRIRRGVWSTSKSMPDKRRRNCKLCKGHDSTVGPISWEGYCFPCGRVVYEENIRQLQTHTGPFAQHHRRQCVAAWGGVLLEDLTA